MAMKVIRIYRPDEQRMLAALTLLLRGVVPESHGRESDGSGASRFAAERLSQPRRAVRERKKRRAGSPVA